MRNKFIYLLLILATAAGTHANSGDCSCGYHVDSNGFGMCKKQYPALNNRLVCYVNKPSTCSDLQPISTAPDLHLSAAACQAIDVSDQDTGGQLIDEDFQSSEEVDNNQRLNKTHYFEEGLFEGDIIMDQGISAAVNIPQRKWPKSEDGHVYIPFSFPSTATKDEKAAIARTVTEFNNNTCIRLTPYNATTDFDYIHFNTRGLGCKSYVGRRGGRQVIRCHYCLNNGGSWALLAHEVLHSLGMYHEHSRPDRDDYIDIDWDELTVVAQEDHLFRLERDYQKCTTCSSWGPYDFNSLLHYPSVRGRQNRTIIRPKEGMCADQESCQMGQRQGLSPLDVEDIQMFYGCDLTFSQHQNQCAARVSKEIITAKVTQRNRLFQCVDGDEENYEKGNKSDSYQDLKESNNRLQIEMDNFKNEVNSKLVEIMNHLTSSSIKGVDMRQLNSPAIDCKWSYWQFGNCTQECGTGHLLQQREISILAENGGNSCSGDSYRITNIKCNTNPCPVHCEWNHWVIGECSLECGSGMRTNKREEKVSAEHGGEECPGASSIEESCNVQECSANVWRGLSGSKHWGRNACTYLRMKTHSLSFEQCKLACQRTENCNAFIHHITSGIGCHTLACPVPIPTPDVDSIHWKGYYPAKDLELKWSEIMPKRSVQQSESYCTTWTAFIKNLKSQNPKSITIGAEGTSYSCNDPATAKKITDALSQCLQACSRKSFLCSGEYWTVGNGLHPRILVGGGGLSSCGTSKVILRPCIGNNNWGGAGVVCAAQSQRLTMMITL